MLPPRALSGDRTPKYRPASRRRRRPVEKTPGAVLGQDVASVSDRRDVSPGPRPRRARRHSKTPPTPPDSIVLSSSGRRCAASVVEKKKLEAPRGRGAP